MISSVSAAILACLITIGVDRTSWTSVRGHLHADSSIVLQVNLEERDTLIVLDQPVILLLVNRPYCHQCVHDVMRWYGRQKAMPPLWILFNGSGYPVLDRRSVRVFRASNPGEGCHMGAIDPTHFDGLMRKSVAAGKATIPMLLVLAANGEFMSAPYSIVNMKQARRLTFRQLCDMLRRV